MERTMSGVSTSATESPRNTSAPFSASSSVRMSRSVANRAFMPSRPGRSRLITPLLSHMTRLSGFTPSVMYILEQETAAAPAPFTTTRTSPIFFPATSSALSRAAAEIMAVPCWSSCITGMSSSLRSRSSMTKHSGALISSRLMPPKVGEMFLTVRMNSSASCVSTSMSKTSMSANVLKSSPFPSMTGLPASAPMSPRPSTAVPLEMTATRLVFEVYLYASSGFFSISRHG